MRRTCTPPNKPLHRTVNSLVQFDWQSRLAAYWVDFGRPGQRCCRPVNADPLGGMRAVLDVGELRDRLVREGISDSAYSIGDPLSDNSHCIVETPHSWVVFFLERGERNEVHAFQTFPEAAHFFVERLLADLGTRQ